MPNQTPVVLVTRPEKQAHEFSATLGAGVDVVISPVIRIEPRDISVEARNFDALIFTSPNGVLAASRSLDLKGLRAVTVGDRTAQVANSFGMLTISARGVAEDLVATVIQEYAGGRVLFIRGRHTRGNIETKLKNAGIDTESCIAYDQCVQPLSEQAGRVLCGERPVILPLFSPRSAVLLSIEASACQASAKLYLIGMSDNVIAGWTGPAPVSSVAVSPPTSAAMAAEILGRIAHWP